MQKNYANISDLCKSLLNNAIFEVAFQGFPVQVIFKFYVVGTSKKVLVSCKSIENLMIKKEPLQEAFFTTLETKIYEKKPSNSWVLEINGPDLFCTIICNELEWKLSEMTESDIAMFK